MEHDTSSASVEMEGVTLDAIGVATLAAPAQLLDRRVDSPFNRRPLGGIAGHIPRVRYTLIHTRVSTSHSTSPSPPRAGRSVAEVPGCGAPVSGDTMNVCDELEERRCTHALAASGHHLGLDIRHQRLTAARHQPIGATRGPATFAADRCFDRKLGVYGGPGLALASTCMHHSQNMKRGEGSR